MSEQTVIQTPAKRAPAKRKVRRKRAAPTEPKAPKPASEFAGMTATTCPAGCMRDGFCLISTVNVCKHPNLASDSGCGPITMANREKAKKFLKRQAIERS